MRAVLKVRGARETVVAVGAATLATLAGCKVGPDYVPPQVETPAQYSAGSAGGEAAAPAQLTRWWTTLGDPALEALVSRAVGQNLDLRVAASRIAQARAQRGVVNAGFYPTVDTSADYSYSRASRNLGGPGVNGNNFAVGFDAGWEIDVFGRVARGVESAEADIGAAVENQRDVLVTLLAEVARNYVDFRSLQRRVLLAQQNAKIQRESLGLVETRFNAGLVSELDVARAKALLATTEALIPTLEQAQVAAANRLAVLLGQAPGSLREELAGESRITESGGATVPLGLPSDLLRRRADIRRAEREIASANAQIGVATADLFPRFSLTGSFGLTSLNAGDLFEGSSRFWSVGPTVRWNIFDAGRINANIAVQEARTREAYIRYRQSVLAALEDVENSLTGWQKEQTRRQALAEAVVANQRSVELATELNTRGLTDYLSVLDAQRNLFQTQDQLAQSEGVVVTNLIALYKALGGGWEELPTYMAPERPLGITPSWVTEATQGDVDQVPQPPPTSGPEQAPAREPATNRPG